MKCISQSFYYEVVSFFRIIQLAKHDVFLSADVNVEKKTGTDGGGWHRAIQNGLKEDD